LDKAARQKPAHQKRLARRVRELRKANGMKQDDLEDFGLHWKTVQAIEYARGDVKLSTLIKLARAFDLTVAELLHAVVPDRPPRRR
jgi:DNA-binding XRE family transcriptional regulator